MGRAFGNNILYIQRAMSVKIRKDLQQDGDGREIVENW